MPVPTEVVKVVVNGVAYTDWESVFYQQTFGEVFRTIRLTVSEDSPPRPWSQIRITPGDVVDVFLGGVPAVRGVVVERQVYYDAHRHGLMIIAQSFVADIAKTTVKRPQEFKNSSWLQVARALLQPYGFSVTVAGNSSNANIPFPDITTQPGDYVYNRLEQLGRQVGLGLIDNAAGNELIAYPMADASFKPGDFGPVTATLVEGRNIISARCVVSDLSVISESIGFGQRAGNDATWGKDASDLYADVPNSSLAGRGRYLPWATVTEHPTTQQLVQLRAQYEIAWRELERIKAQITIQGWFRDDGQLWQVTDQVRLQSPMLAMNQPLIIQSVTCTQDNTEGSLTVLDLVNRPAFTGGQIQLGGGNSGPDINDPATTPPQTPNPSP